MRNRPRGRELPDWHAFGRRSDPIIGSRHHTSGNFVVIVSSVDLCQGLKTILAQIAAKTLGVPFETAIVDTGDTDTETGSVQVLSIKSAYEVGQQVNPALVKGQIVRGAWMGMGHALQESTAPYYPAIDHAPIDFQGHVMPGTADVLGVESEILEIAFRNGPFGAKGVGEMVTNSPIPAIVNAINNALGVRITQIPVTPEVCFAP